MELVCSLCLGRSEGHIVFMSNENQVGVSASTSPPLAGGRGASQKNMNFVAGGLAPCPKKQDIRSGAGALNSYFRIVVIYTQNSRS